MNDARQERGLAMAARCRILSKNGKWIVPSATGSGTYLVDPVKGKPTCTCPDFETRNIRCKHIWAAAFTARDVGKRQAEQPPKPAPKPTYRQAWASYNKAQTGEKGQYHEIPVPTDGPHSHRATPSRETPTDLHPTSVQAGLNSVDVPTMPEQERCRASTWYACRRPSRYPTWAFAY